MSSDGKSLLTSVGVRDYTVWIHDARGDRQLSSEGDAFGTSSRRDGSKLYYLMQSGQNSGVEPLGQRAGQRKNRTGGFCLFAVLSGSTMESYDVSHDDKQVVFSLKDQNGLSHVWLASTDHRSSPHLLPSDTSQDSPFFLPNGDLVLRSTEDGAEFLVSYSPGRLRNGGKVNPEAITDLDSVSTRWTLGGGPGQGNGRRPSNCHLCLSPGWRSSHSRLRLVLLCPMGHAVGSFSTSIPRATENGNIYALPREPCSRHSEFAA